jgi:large subunit ribosomal protein L24
MATAFKLRKGSTVVVVAGNHKGKQGKLLGVSDSGRALVEGVHIIKKHLKRSAAHPDGGIVEREGPIHVSNLKLVEEASQ